MDININKKTLTFIIGTVIVGVIAAILYILLSDNTGEQLPPKGIEQPLGYQLEQEVEIPRDITPEDLKRKYKLLKVSQDSHDDLAQDIVTTMGKSDLGYSRSGETSHVWGDLFKEGGEYIYYEELTDSLSISFKTPAYVEGGSAGISDETAAKSVFLNTINELFGNDYKYQINNVELSNREYRVEASRLVDGVPVELPGLAEYSDFLVFNESGYILRGQLLLAEFQDPLTIGIIDFDDLPELLTRDAYPANYTQGAPLNYVPKQSSAPVDHADTPGDEEAIEQSTSCVVTSAQVVYYYSTVDQLHLSPTYKLSCIGNITIDGLGFEVPVLVYTNAVDPEYVYIPAELTKQ